MKNVKKTQTETPPKINDGADVKIRFVKSPTTTEHLLANNYGDVVFVKRELADKLVKDGVAEKE